MAKYLADHRTGECKFPVGDEPANGDMSRQLFCCEPAVPGEDYCDCHGARVFKHWGGRK